MIRRRPTPVPRIARRRILDYVEETGEPCFTADDVAVELPTLARLVHAGSLKATRGKGVYCLPENAALHQEARFGQTLLKIRRWTNATGKYRFIPSQVEVHGEVLNMIVAGGLLERKGHKYTVFWRSLVGYWQQTLKNVQEAEKDEFA